MPVAGKFRVDTTDIRCYKRRLPDWGVNKKIEFGYGKKGF
jgi:hypothetical protein